MPNKPKRSSSTRRKPAGSKSPGKHDLTKPRQAGKTRSAGFKSSHRTYKPRKPKAKKPRSADSILKEARATRKSLIRKGSRRPTAKAPSGSSPTISRRSQRSSSRIFAPILRAAGNAPIVASGRGQYDERPEVWSADDFYVIVEAEPECAAAFARKQIGFRYLMSASCFYRESRSPHSGARRHPIAIFTLEHSSMLPHSEPGFFDRLLGEEAKPLSMVVGAFIGDVRLSLDSVIFDDNFTNGRRRLLSLVRDHVGISPYFDFSGYLNRGETLPAMK
jgi:hypothetical protein